MDALSALIGFAGGLLFFALFAAVAFSRLCDSIAKLDCSRLALDGLRAFPQGRAMEAADVEKAAGAYPGRDRASLDALAALAARPAANDPVFESAPIPASLKKPKCRFCSRVKSFFK